MSQELKTNEFLSQINRGLEEHEQSQRAAEFEAQERAAHSDANNVSHLLGKVSAAVALCLVIVCGILYVKHEKAIKQSGTNLLRRTLNPMEHATFAAGNQNVIDDQFREIQRRVRKFDGPRFKTPSFKRKPRPTGIRIGN